MDTHVDESQIDEFDSDQNRNLKVHLVQSEVDMGTCREIENTAAACAIYRCVKDIGCFEIKHFRLHIESADVDTAENANGEVVGEARHDVGFFIGECRGLITDFRTNLDEV